MRQRVQQSGFTLIEAIVSMVLISTLGLTLFSWINTSVITLSRVQESNRKNAATLNVLEYMGAVNPMLMPSGDIVLGGYKATWESELTVGPRDGANYPAGVGLYEFGLYNTKVDVTKISESSSPGEIWFSMTLQQVGYKKVRNIKIGF